MCILGRNGSGKSTLLKAIAGEIGPDSGTIAFPEGGVATSLPQELPSQADATVGDIVTRGFGKDGDSLLSLHAGVDHPHLDPERQWQMETAIEKTSKELGLDARSRYSELSGGLKRRTLLGAAIVAEPDVLVLDEPTNHLDLDSIVWLENFLLSKPLTLMFVTHDQAFLKRLATRIVEIDLGRLTSFRCDYETYLLRKEALQNAEERNRASFEKKLSQEEAWLRKGIRARRTRNEGRVKALQKMREERLSWRQQLGQASFALQGGEASGNKVITAERVSAKYEGKTLLQTFDAKIMRGDRIGIIGPNGSGKTTLIKLLLGEIEPDTGSIEHGAKLKIAYFDQMREQLDETLTVMECVADGNESVTINGKSRHVITYLQDFLFSPERARVSSKTLSGGERNRLLLARLFTQPANLVVLDEPTNDLDSETLELLEDRILAFEGTLLIVSHDRDFLEATVTSLIVIEEGGAVVEHPGGYLDWTAKKNQLPKRLKSDKPSKRSWKQKKRVFTNKERIELEELPARIESLEARKEAIVERLADPTIYQSQVIDIESLKSELDSIERKLTNSFERWEELETLKESLTGADS